VGKRTTNWRPKRRHLFISFYSQLNHKQHAKIVIWSYSQTSTQNTSHRHFNIPNQPQTRLPQTHTCISLIHKHILDINNAESTSITSPLSPHTSTSQNPINIQITATRTNITKPTALKSTHQKFDRNKIPVLGYFSASQLTPTPLIFTTIELHHSQHYAINTNKPKTKKNQQNHKIQKKIPSTNIKNQQPSPINPTNSITTTSNHHITLHIIWIKIFRP
jgi:hypothetical protein